MQQSMWGRVSAEFAKGRARLAGKTGSLFELVRQRYEFLRQKYAQFRGHAARTVLRRLPVLFAKCRAQLAGKASSLFELVRQRYEFLLQKYPRFRDHADGITELRRLPAQFAKGRTSLATGISTIGAKTANLRNLEWAPPQRLQYGLAMFYEAVAFDTLRALWRNRLLIASFVAAGLVLAVLGILVVERRYSADAVIQLDFAREDPARKTPPSAAMDAAILVEGEARLIRSAALARRVVTRLKLDEDPGYASLGLFARFLSVLRAPAAGAPSPSKIDLAARRLAQQLTVTNDNRSYLINISIMSNSPEWSAKLANAFAVEYLNDRVIQRLREAEAGARGALGDARATYGEKHPSVIQANAQLAAAEARTREQEKLGAERPDELRPAPGQSFLKAEPVWIPAGPNSVAFLAIGLLGSLLAAIGLALLLERRDTGFRTEIGVPAEIGVRCVGMIPRNTDGIPIDRGMEQREAFRSLCLTAGLAGRSAGCSVVMITSALPGQGKPDFVRGLSCSLMEEGQRVLVIDASHSSHVGSTISLDDVLGNSELMQQFLTGQSNQPISELRRKSGLNGARNPFASFASTARALEQLLAEAKTHYDVVIIDTPPALLFADSIFLGRFADISLHVANWNETPRATVAAAVNRLRENMVRVDGIVLIEVDLGEYPSFAAGDRTYYLSKHHHAFSLHS